MQVAKLFPLIHPANSSNLSFDQALAPGVTTSSLPLDRAASLHSSPDVSMTEHGVMQQGAREWRAATTIDVLHHPFGEPPPQVC